MGRRGCAVCKKELGKFAYRVIGLCCPCRKKVANQFGKQIKKVDCATIGMFAITRNLTKEEVSNLFSDEVLTTSST
jgi:hypothetical protein